MLMASIRVCVLLAVALAAGCVQVAAPQVTSAPVQSTATPAAVPTANSGPLVTAAPNVAGSPLQPDEDAPYTLGDTARLEGGEFVGDQADLAVLEAIEVSPSDNAIPRFAFLVEITGLDDATFPFNLLDFQVIDEQSFRYGALDDGGQEPRLEFGNLSPNQKVRGWLTFEVSEPTTTVQLEYAPALALEPAVFGFIVP